MLMTSYREPIRVAIFEAIRLELGLPIEGDSEEHNH